MVGEFNLHDKMMQDMLNKLSVFLRENVDGFETLAELRWMVQDLDDFNQYYIRGVKVIDDDGSKVYVAMDEYYSQARVVETLIRELR